MCNHLFATKKQQNKSINKGIKLTNECVVTDKMNEYMKWNEAARFSYNLALRGCRCNDRWARW